MTMKDVKWFSVWNNPNSTSLGDLVISQNVTKSILKKWYTGRDAPSQPPVKDYHTQESAKDKPLAQKPNGILSHSYIDMKFN